MGADGRIYLAETIYNQIRMVGADGVISIVAGSGLFGSSGDGGPALQAKLWSPKDVAVGPDGGLYIADHINNRIRKVSRNGIISTIAGNGSFGQDNDGVLATTTGVSRPFAIEVDQRGNLYILHGGTNFGGTRVNYRLRRVGSDGLINSLGGGAAD